MKTNILTSSNVRTAASRILCLSLVMNLLISPVGITSAAASIALSKTMTPGARAKAESAFANLPLSFEINRGQTDASVKFLARGKGYTLFLTASEAVLSLKAPAASKDQAQDVVRMKLNGANAEPAVQGLELLPSQRNYMTGNDPSKWQTRVEQYSKVAVKQVYDGIDMVYYGNQGQLEYDFLVAPGANPALIRMDFSGAKSIKLDKQGNLILNSKMGKLTFNAPVLYQKIGDARVPVTGRFVLASGKQVRFQVGDYDKGRELVIDPTLTYSTFLGTTVEDRANAIALDATGNVYLTGQTATVADLFPGTAGHFQSSNNGGAFDAFVIKISPAGAIVWATYLGGDGIDIGKSIAVDGSNIVHITGSTTDGGGAQYPTANPYQPTNLGGTDAFVTAIAADGNSLVYSTFLGGAGVEFGNGLAVDSAGNAYVTGGTTSNNTTFPATAGAFQTDNGVPAGPVPNAFVAKFNAAGTVQYITYLGGSVTGGTHGNAIAIDGTGNAYVTGQCRDTFPTFPLNPAPGLGAFKETITGSQAAFISKLDSTGANLLYSSYLNGSGISEGTGVKLDSTGNVYVAGDTDSTDFPDAGSDGVTTSMPKVGQTTITGNFDGFVIKMALNATGHSDGVYCTFLGGSGLDHVTALTVDSFGGAYVTGRTESGDFLTAGPGSIQTSLFTVQDGTAKTFVTALGVAGNTREFNTYIGGVTDQEGRGIALDTEHNIYVAGWTNSFGFPTAGSAPMPLFAAKAGAQDGYVLKISATSPGLSVPPTITSVVPAIGFAAGGATVVIFGTGFFNMTVSSGIRFDGVDASTYTVFSSTRITAVTPAHAEGTVNIVATSPSGSSLNTSADDYVYSNLPAITNVNPSVGLPAGGNKVFITGSGFLGITAASGVMFDATPAPSYTVDSNTQITAFVPEHAVGTVNIVVTNAVGSSPNTPADDYTYAISVPAAPTITSLSPALGLLTGGTTVVITGTGFAGIAGATGVKFGGVNAPSYAVNSNTRITAMTPAHGVGIVDVMVTSPFGSSPNTIADDYRYFSFLIPPLVTDNTGSGDCVEPYIYPSPATGNTAYIVTCMAGPGNMNIRVYNELGDLVNTLEERKPAGPQSTRVDIGDLSPGVYIYLLKRIYDDGNTAHSKHKFVVLH